MATTHKHTGFWVLCEVHESESDPLTASPGLGEALAVFGFGEEALLYELLSGKEGERRAIPVDTAELSALLSGPWFRFERVTLVPLPGPGLGLVDRPDVMGWKDFLALLASRALKTRGAALSGAHR